MTEARSELSLLTAPAATAEPGARFSGVRKLLQSRGGWALVDQGVVSLGNCLMGIILVGVLPLAEFGAFTLLFGVLLFVNGLHQALVTYPLSVRGAASDAAALRGRAGSSLLVTLALAAPLGVGVALTCVVLGRPSLIPWALAAMLCWQVQETLRRAIMSRLRHRLAVAGDAVRYLGLVIVLLVLARVSGVTLSWTLAAMAGTSLLAAAVQAWQLRPGLAPGARRLVGEWWVLGRWVLLTNVITIVTVQAMPWTLGAFHGDAEVARFGALALVMGITNPIILGIGGLVIPAAAGTAASKGTRGARRVAIRFGLQGAALLLPYYAAVWLAPELVVRLFTHASPAYAGLGSELRLFALAYLLVFPAQVIGSLLNGLGHSRASFLAQCAFSAATLLVSLPLAAAYGLAGAVWGGLLPALAYLVASAAMLRRYAAAGSPGGAVGPASGEAGGSRGAVALEAEGVAA